MPAIYGVDTRMITKTIRMRGSMLGKVVVAGSQTAEQMAFVDPNADNLSARVSRKEPEVFLPPKREPGTPEGWTKVAEEMGQSSPTAGAVATETPRRDPMHICAVDCGVKNNIIRFLVTHLRVKVTVVPWDYDFTEDKFDGLFLSNGPGDPTKLGKTIEHIRKFMQKKPSTPIFGICLGNQLLALAAGATTYKMKFGNRGMNQPCIDLRTTRCYIYIYIYIYISMHNSIHMYDNADDNDADIVTP